MNRQNVYPRLLAHLRSAARCEPPAMPTGCGILTLSIRRLKGILNRGKHLWTDQPKMLILTYGELACAGGKNSRCSTALARGAKDRAQPEALQPSRACHCAHNLKTIKKL